MDGFSVGDIQLPADFDQRIAAQLAAQGYNFAVQPSAPATAAPATAAPANAASNFAVQQDLPIEKLLPVPQAIKPSVPDLRADMIDPDFAVQSSMPSATAANNFAVQQGSPFGATAGLPNFSVPSNPPSFDPNVMAVDDFIPRGPPRTSTASPADLFNVNKTGLVNEQGMGENPPTLAVAGATGTAAPTNLTVANATGTAAPTNLTVAGATGAVPIGPGVTLNPQGLTTPEVPTITATPAAAFDYSRLSTGEPQLVAAGASYKNNATGQMVLAGTDHYVTYTNDGDFAGTVMVAPGQKIRMVDAIDGSIVFEGTGPEGAKQATAIANAMSQDKGRKAAWKIEAENEQGGYTTQASERYDPKKQSFFGKLADIALPIIGIVLAFTPGGQALLAGMVAAGGSIGLSAAAVQAGVGAAAGSTLSSVGQGRSLKDTALRAAISGIGAGAGAQFFPAAPAPGLSPASGVNGIAANALPGSVALINTPQTLASGIAGIGGGAGGGALSGGGSWIQGLDITAPARTVAPMLGTKIASSVGALAPNLISGSSGNDVLRGDPADDMKGQSQGDNTIEELVVTGRKLAEAAVANPYLDPNALAALVPGATFDMAMNAILNNPPATTETAKPGQFNSEEVVVTGLPAQKAALTTLQKTLIVGGLITSAALAAQLTASGVPTTEAEAKNLMDSVKEPFGVAAKVAGAGVLAAGALGDVLGGGGGSGGGAGGAGGTSSLQQQRANLSPIFRAQLGAPRGLFSVLGSTPTLPNSRPGNNFSVTPSGGTAPTTATLPATTATPTTATTPATAGVPSTPSLSAYLALYPDVAAAAAKDPSGYGDADGDGTITARDFALGHYLRYGVKEGRKMGAKAGGAVHGYAHGSSPRREFAVQGRGTGRSDSIPAVLSDGEYVMDAETVALLGDGSSKAGAAKLDQFRVSVRKHKGRDLARGKFSVNAKRPEAYLSGGAS